METLAMGKTQKHTKNLAYENRSHDISGLRGQSEVSWQLVLDASKFSLSLESLIVVFTGHKPCHASVFRQVCSLNVSPSWKTLRLSVYPLVHK